jgi:CBS domain-containing protein
MLALSGWFLASAARSVDRRIAVEDLLRGVTIGDAMERDLPAIPPQLTLDTFADRFFGEGGASTLPIVRDDELLGVISPSQLRSVGKGAWTTTRAEELMVALADLEVLAPSESVWSGLDRLRRTGLDGLPVIDGSALLGVLTRRSVIKAIQAQAAMRGESVP